jgi:hypothetical protein
MQLPLLIAGLVLVIAGGGWFAAATTVGWICLGVFAAITLLQVLILVGVVALGSK